MQLVFQGFLQLFVHRLADLGQPPVGTRLHGGKADLHGGADAFELLFGLHGVGPKASRHTAGELLPGLADLGQQVLAHRFQIFA